MIQRESKHVAIKRETLLEREFYLTSILLSLFRMVIFTLWYIKYIHTSYV
jgi:hypothetical protein